jgi:probable F420-dependent oxidoreductase
MRPFRFGVMANHTLAPPQDGKAWADFCRRAEDLGYSSVLLSDHLYDPLTPVPAMMAAADATSTLRVGALVFGNDYRHPAMLAKEVAVVDVLSGGRVEFGLGAGWKATDYEQSGIRQDPAGVRVDRLVESVAVLKGLWADGPFSYAGEHYRITDLDSVPKPRQRPHPPVLLGGGSKRVLSVAGREADIVGVNRALRSGSVDAGALNDSSARSTDRKVGWIREAAGERFDRIELNMVVPDLVITGRRRQVAEDLAGPYQLSPDEVLEVPHLWVGTVEEICADVVRRRERWGVSYLMVIAKDMEAAAPVVARLAGT